MDMEKNNPIPDENQDWFDEILGTSQIKGEIGPDEQAVYAAGLTHPDDMELEKIVQETLAEDWGMPEPEQPQAEEVSQDTQMFTPVQPEEPRVDERPQREKPRHRRKPEPEEKGRPKKKKGYGLLGIPHIISTLLWLGIMIAIGVTMGRTVWLCAADLLAFHQTPPQNLQLVVRDDDTIVSVAQQLKEKGLIRYPQLFVFFADLTGKGEDISVGTYVLNAPDKETGEIPTLVFDYNALLNSMRASAPSRQTVKIMFPEGYNCAQMFAVLEEKGVCSVADLEAYAASGELDDYWFLEGVERGHKYCLEGFMAPDTYEFYTNDEPERVLEKFLDEFDDRFSDRMHEQFQQLQTRFADNLKSRGYGEEFIQENMLTIRDVVTLASMVEKETANDSESFDVASVFFNRLSNPGNFPFLNSDATVLYAIDYYNKGELITDEQINASPYNTYTYQGLPAGPISNPGANSMYAALSPNDTGYYYFIYDSNAGVHRFSKTLSEHERWGRELGLM